MRQTDDAYAMRLRALDAERHRLGADHLAVAALAVEREQRPLVGAHGDVAVDGQAAFQNRIDVARHHAHAVRIVAAQVGLDEVVGHAPGFGIGRAGGADDAAHCRAERVGPKDVGFDHRQRP